MNSSSSDGACRQAISSRLTSLPALLQRVRNPGRCDGRKPRRGPCVFFTRGIDLRCHAVETACLQRWLRRLRRGHNTRRRSSWVPWNQQAFLRARACLTFVAIQNDIFHARLNERDKINDAAKDQSCSDRLRAAALAGAVAFRSKGRPLLANGAPRFSGYCWKRSPKKKYRPLS